MTTNVRRAAASLLGATALLHLLLAPEYLEEQAYVGVLFILGGLTGVVLAYRLWKTDDLFAWSAGTLIALGMGAGFVLSRTVGLPGFHESEWEASGLLSMLLEGGFVALALPALRRGLPGPLDARTA